MLTFVRTLWLAIALAACSESKPAGADWSSRPLETVSGTVGSDPVGTIAFTIELPRGFTLDPRATGGVTVGYEVTPHDLTAPSVLIGYEAILPKSLDEAVSASLPGPDDTIVRKEEIVRGYIVTTRGERGERWRVNVLKISGDKGVACMAQQADMGAKHGDATRALLEKICLSLRTVAS